MADKTAPGSRMLARQCYRCLQRQARNSLGTDPHGIKTKVFTGTVALSILEWPAALTSQAQSHMPSQIRLRDISVTLLQKICLLHTARYLECGRLVR